jgi:hypothetical protein
VRHGEEHRVVRSDGLLMFRGKIYVPKDRDLRHRIVKQHHDMCITGHAGCFKTLKLVSCNYCHATTGGSRCPDTLDSMSKHLTYAIGLSCNIINLMENSTLQRLQELMGHH